MLYRLGYIFLLLTAAIALPLGVHLARPWQGDAPAYVGSSQCARCHNTPMAEAGFARWAQSPHARAYQTLQGDSAVGYLRTHNESVSNCLPCHSTLGRAALNQAEQPVMEEGVGCESCHGPGSRYAYYAVMTDTAQFKANGGSHGSLKDCSGCHRHTGPQKCPFVTSPFNPDKSWKLLRHPLYVDQGAPSLAE